MRCYYFPNSNLGIFWTPKCACTSLLDWCIQLSQKEELPYNESIEIEGFEETPQFPKSRKFFNQNYLLGKRFLGKTGLKPVVVVRKPIPRLISAFINKFLVYNGEPITELESFAKRFKNKYISPNFVTFNNVIQGIKNNKVSGYPVEPHLAPQMSQVRWVYFNNNPPLIARVENLQDDINKITDELGLDRIKLSRSNVSKMPNDWKETDDDLSNVSVEDLIGNKIWPRKENLINKENLKNIYSLYDLDFKFMKRYKVYD